MIASSAALLYVQFIVAVVYGEFMYVFGGFNGKKQLHFNQVHRYDPGRL